MSLEVSTEEWRPRLREQSDTWTNDAKERVEWLLKVCHGRSTENRVGGARYRTNTSRVPTALLLERRLEWLILVIK